MRPHMHPNSSVVATVLLWLLFRGVWVSCESTTFSRSKKIAVCCCCCCCRQLPVIKLFFQLTHFPFCSSISKQMKHHICLLVNIHRVPTAGRNQRRSTIPSDRSDHCCGAVASATSPSPFLISEMVLTRVQFTQDSNKCHAFRLFLCIPFCFLFNHNPFPFVCVCT